MKIFDAVDSMAQVLDFQRARHTVLAGNLANVDTPGYRPFDLERSGATSGGNTGNGMAVARTNSGHMSAGGPASVVTSFDDSSQSVGADGNAVNLERELAKVDANRIRYSAVAEVVSKRLALLRYAAGDGV